MPCHHQRIRVERAGPSHQNATSGTSTRLDALEARVTRNREWYSGIPLLGSSFEFLAKVFDGWLR